MRVLHITPEIYPYVKTGGLADVAGALPLALQDTNIDSRMCLPGFEGILDHLEKPETVIRFANYFGTAEPRLLRGQLDNGLTAYVLEDPGFYKRKSLYVNENGADWPDNPFRFAALAKIAADLHLYDPDWQADILHSHDWQGGLAPLYSQLSPNKTPPKTVLTIHNMAYQGLFSAQHLSALGLPMDFYKAEGIEYYQKIGFLKAGLFYADQITTVSPTYAEEIQTADFGCGLDGLLSHRRHSLTGIINGIDTNIWSPETDSALPCTFSSKNLSDKKKNRQALIKEFGLSTKQKGPLFTVISRMSPQKGLDLIIDVLPYIIAKSGQVIVLGSGDEKLEAAYMILAKKHPDHIAVSTAYDEALAHRLIGGADALLMPSLFEPCGLVQMYALAYGTIPVVRATGGLADTVKDNITGFKFQEASAAAFRTCLDRAFASFADPKAWKALQQAAMTEDFSWKSSAAAYTRLYQHLLGPAQTPAVLTTAPKSRNAKKSLA